MSHFLGTIETLQQKLWCVGLVSVVIGASIHTGAGIGLYDNEVVVYRFASGCA